MSHRRRGPFRYPDYKRNHAIWPGREGALAEFVTKRYGGRQLKLDNAHSSNSEDALTWSCFDTLACLSPELRSQALADLWEVAFNGAKLPPAVRAGAIFVGRDFGELKDKTEVDAGIEGPEALVFIEAKLYSSMSLADPQRNRPHDQIAKKLRVGVRHARSRNQEFYFLVLDVAPPEKLRRLCPGASLKDAQQLRGSDFDKKWATAYWFQRYQGGRGGSTSPLAEMFRDDPVLRDVDAATVAQNMGWLTWADVTKAVLRALLSTQLSAQRAP